MAAELNFTSAKRNRAGAASWLTRSTNVCGELEKKDLRNVSNVEYENAVGNFEKRLLAWDDAENVVESLLEEADIEQEINSAADYRERCERVKLSLMATWAKTNVTDSRSEGLRTESESSTQRSVRLPKLDLPKFNGSVVQFMPFWQQFESCVDSQDLPDVSKFNYLVSCLKGEAKSALDGLPITAENYADAKKIVLKRFGRTELIVFSHIQALLNLDVPDTTQLQELSLFRDKLVANTRSLAAHNITSENFGVILTPIIISRLPEEIRLEWSRGSEGKEADLDHLMAFLETEIGRRERCRSFGALSTKKPEMLTQRRREPRPQGSATALHAESAQHSTRGRCGVCGKSNHPVQRCFVYLKLNVAERQRRVECQKLCFKCLGKNHFARDCDAVCKACKGTHHESLCYGTKKESVPQGESDAVLSVNRSRVAFLPTATVQVRQSDGKWSTATVLFDSGSDKSYVSNSLVSKVKPKYVKSTETRFSTFGGRSYSSKSKVYEMYVKGANGDAELIQATEVPVICSPLSRPNIESEMLAQFNHLPLADELLGQNQNVRIDLLIGQDLFWSLMRGNTFRPDENCGIVAQESVFGWVLSAANSSIKCTCLCQPVKHRRYP